MIDDRLRYLLLRYYRKRASAEERDELMELLRDGAYDEEVRSLIAELINNQGRFGEVLEDGRAEEILKNIFLAETPANESEDIYTGEVAQEFEPPRRRWALVFRSLPAAASIAFLAFLGIYWATNGNPLAIFGKTATSENTSSVPAAGELPPAGERALLTLWDGTVFSLDTTETQSPDKLTRTPPGFEIDQEKGELVYNGTKTRKGYNSLSTPLGGQYKLVLPDGSKAWLNAGSTLKFPTSFDVRSRRVEVTGEVFFEVKNDKNRPFVVSLPRHKVQGEPMEIMVLGTEFNVSSYREDPVIQTTLVKGSVRVKKGNDSRVLSPGEQAEVRFADVRVDNVKKENEAGNESGIEIKNVDVESVTAWKEGRFEFNGSIEGIMRQIARWYAVEVEFEDDLRSREFVGAISRKENAAEVLKMLELTGGIRFEIKGQKIKVKAI